MSPERQRVFVTGATGLIGSALVRRLLRDGASVIVLARDSSKARRLFGDSVEVISGDVTAALSVEGRVDLIVHAASPTSSAFFAEHPVETISTAVDGTRRMLELAREKDVKKFVYLSSMEVYGTGPDGRPIGESAGSTWDVQSPRASYPESKRLCEALCAAYASEYGVPACILRLAQTFGPGVARDDARVFAEFARRALAQEPIVLKTSGESRRQYLDVEDAAEAIVTLLASGEAGLAYNAGNPATYCSIAEMAELVSRTLGGAGVRFEPAPAAETVKYTPTHRLNLDVSRLTALGWSPRFGLAEIYRRMADAWREVR